METITEKNSLLNEINFLHRKIDAIENRNKNAELFLVVDRMKQLEAVNKTISKHYNHISLSLNRIVEVLNTLSVDISNTSKSIETVNGYTNHEIDNMSSDEYVDKVLSPLGIKRDEGIKLC